MSLVKRHTVWVFVVAVVTFVSLSSVYMLRAQESQYPYVENGALYKSGVSSSGVKVADNVDRLLTYDIKTGKLLALGRSNEINTDHEGGVALILIDTVSGDKKTIAQDAVGAHISPNSDKVVIENSKSEINVLSINGKPLKHIGVHGVAPIFSNDGKYVAYHKLADTSQDGDRQGLFETSPYGIVLYDLTTDKEIVLTKNKDDFAPIAFSADGTKLYFNSTRAYPSSKNNVEDHVASLWVVDIKTGAVKRLTNLDEDTERQGIHIPIVSDDALRSSDGKTLISSNGSTEGIWQFTFDTNGDLAGAEHIVDGESPRWVILDKSIAVRFTSNGKGSWRTVNVR